MFNKIGNLTRLKKNTSRHPLDFCLGKLPKIHNTVEKATQDKDILSLKKTHDRPKVFNLPSLYSHTF